MLIKKIVRTETGVQTRGVEIHFQTSDWTFYGGYQGQAVPSATVTGLGFWNDWNDVDNFYFYFYGSSK